MQSAARWLAMALLAACLLSACTPPSPVPAGVPLAEIADGVPWRVSGVRPYWLVRSGDTVRAFADIDPKNGIGLEAYEAEQPRLPAGAAPVSRLVLRDPFHFSTYDAAGYLRSGPSPYNLTRYRVTTANGVVSVDTTSPLCMGPSPGDNPALPDCPPHLPR